MINRLRPEDVMHPKLGAPFGNRNAHKHGLRSAQYLAWRKRKEDWRRRVRAALKTAYGEGGVG